MEENSDSTNTSGTSTPAVQEAPGMSASAKRFDYLLKQTELFSHFMGNKSNSPQKVRLYFTITSLFISYIFSPRLAGRRRLRGRRGTAGIGRLSRRRTRSFSLT